MDSSQLEDNIRIVFDKEVYDLKEGRRTYFYTKSNDNLILNYPNAATLVEIFSSLQNDNKLTSFFVSLLKKTIIDSEETLWGQRTGGFSLVGISTHLFQKTSIFD